MSVQRKNRVSSIIVGAFSEKSFILQGTRYSVGDYIESSGSTSLFPKLGEKFYINIRFKITFNFDNMHAITPILIGTTSGHQTLVMHFSRANARLLVPLVIPSMQDVSACGSVELNLKWQEDPSEW